ncbi:hypothetical protein C8R43DRAFT_951189 [Mycena crocata]|nr:hypothetical protein C8R43DRAFT_951186 [Mycena crocata]KAJ7151382.1 hypothetical protein C8R43DRAFT_951189 [Mycena crocata]
MLRLNRFLGYQISQTLHFLRLSVPIWFNSTSLDCTKALWRDHCVVVPFEILGACLTTRCTLQSIGCAFRYVGLLFISSTMLRHHCSGIELYDECGVPRVISSLDHSFTNSTMLKASLSQSNRPTRKLDAHFFRSKLPLYYRLTPRCLWHHCFIYHSARIQRRCRMWDARSLRRVRNLVESRRNRVCAASSPNSRATPDLDSALDGLGVFDPNAAKTSRAPTRLCDDGPGLHRPSRNAQTLLRITSRGVCAESQRAKSSSSRNPRTPRRFATRRRQKNAVPRTRKLRQIESRGLCASWNGLVAERNMTPDRKGSCAQAMHDNPVACRLESGVGMSLGALACRGIGATRRPLELDWMGGRGSRSSAGVGWTIGVLWTSRERDERDGSVGGRTYTAARVMPVVLGASSCTGPSAIWMDVSGGVDRSGVRAHGAVSIGSLPAGSRTLAARHEFACTEGVRLGRHTCIADVWASRFCEREGHREATHFRAIYCWGRCMGARNGCWRRAQAGGGVGRAVEMHAGYKDGQVGTGDRGQTREDMGQDFGERRAGGARVGGEGEAEKRGRC